MTDIHSPKISEKLQLVLFLIIQIEDYQKKLQRFKESQVPGLDPAKLLRTQKEQINEFFAALDRREQQWIMAHFSKNAQKIEEFLITHLDENPQDIELFRQAFKKFEHNIRR
jgi:hypothetical protein